MEEDKHIYKRHNKTLLLYHVVCPTKYRRDVVTEERSKAFKDICLEIGERYEIHFIEIGTDGNHVHFLVQSIPMFRPKEVVQIIKSITAKKMFEKYPEMKKELWGSSFWASGYYMNTVGQYGNVEIIRKYVEQQGKKYTQFHQGQLTLFVGLE